MILSLSFPFEYSKLCFISEFDEMSSKKQSTKTTFIIKCFFYLMKNSNHLPPLQAPLLISLLHHHSLNRHLSHNHLIPKYYYLYLILRFEGKVLTYPVIIFFITKDLNISEGYPHCKGRLLCIQAWNVQFLCIPDSQKSK